MGSTMVQWTDHETLQLVSRFFYFRCIHCKECIKWAHSVQVNFSVFLIPGRIKINIQKFFVNLSSEFYFGALATKGMCNLRKGKGKAIPLQVWRGPEGFRRLRLSDFKTVENKHLHTLNFQV
jgi:hypothetical protein